jgi:hypothetical protein
MSRTKTPKSYDMVKNLLLENTHLCQDVINLIGGFVGNTVFKVGEQYIVDEAVYDSDNEDRIWEDDERFPIEIRKTVTIISRTKCFCKILLQYGDIVMKVKICLTENNDEYFQIKAKSYMEFMFYLKSDQYFVISNRENRNLGYSDLYEIKRIYCEDCDKEILEKSMKAHLNSKKHKKNTKL